MADTHYHTCQTCQQSFECLFELGTCNYKCDTCCGPPAMELNNEQWCCAESERGYTCTLTKGHSWHEHIAQTSEQRVVDRWPASPTAESTAYEAEVEATKECPNCGEDIIDDNPAREWDGEDRCKSCYPICSSCKEELDEDNYFSCDKCNDYLCEDCARFCQCCGVYLCESHAENHGV